MRGTTEIIISLALNFNCNGLVIFQILISRIVNIYLEGAEKLSMIEKTKDMRLKILNMSLHFLTIKSIKSKESTCIRISEFEFNLK